MSISSTALGNVTRSSISTRSKPRSLRRSVLRTSFGPAAPAGAAPKNSSRVPPYADATRWSSDTDGSARPRSTRLRYDAEMPARSAAVRSDRLRLVRAARRRCPRRGPRAWPRPRSSDWSAGGAKPRVSRACTFAESRDVLGRVATMAPTGAQRAHQPLASHALSVDGLTPTRRATSPMRMSSTRSLLDTTRAGKQLRCPTRSNLSLLSRL